MKLSCFPAWLSVPLLLLASCDRPAAPAASPPPAAEPAVELADERAVLEAEIATLRAEEQEAAYRLLQQQQAVLASERDDLERERAELDRAKAALADAAAVPAAAPAAEPVVEKPAPGPGPPPRAPRTASAPDDRDYQMFYEGLAPHGDWRESDEYGWVWQPAATRGSDWRPYTQGRWVDSDQGWAWVSDEPFGWATYHYGRWALLVGNGWVWVPGDTWAPAWVAWRRNDECVGWAPLPPETLYAENVTFGPDVEVDFGLSAEWYTFMPVRHFDEPVFSHCRPIAENLQFFSLTVGITNIVVSSDRVVCGGPEPRWINTCVARPMIRHSIRHRQDWHDRRDLRAHIDDNSLSCYSPRVRAEWNDGIRPKHSRGRLDGVRVVRRQESIRDDLSRRYRGERDHRRERAAVAMKQEPVRLLAQRHEELEKLRADRVAAERKQDDRPSRGADVRNRPRQRVQPATTTEAARATVPKNSRDREGAKQEQARPEVAQQGRENDAKTRQAAAEQQARQRERSRRESAQHSQRVEPKERTDQTARNESRSEGLQQEQNGREAAERQQAAQAKERNEQTRRAQDRQNDDRRRDVAERQQAAQAKEQNEQARRAQDRQNDGRRRDVAERQQAAQVREQNEQARRAQDRQNDDRRRDVAERQQAAQAREQNEQARRAQDRQNDDRQHEAQRRQQEGARSKASQSDEARARHKKESDKDR